MFGIYIHFEIIFAISMFLHFAFVCLLAQTNMKMISKRKTA